MLLEPPTDTLPRYRGSVAKRAWYPPSRPDVFWRGVTIMHRSKIRAYSITSSASASNLSGISRPSAFAVLRLDHELELCRQHNRQITRLLAFEDAVRHKCRLDGMHR
jgi:hypothetical protein